MDRDQAILRIESMWAKSEVKIFEDIVRRIQKTGKISATADYQLSQLALRGVDISDIQKELSDMMEISEDEIRNMFDGLLEDQWSQFAETYGRMHSGERLPEDSFPFNAYLEAAMEQTNSEMHNLTQTQQIGIVRPVNGKMVFSPVSGYINSIMDQASYDLSTGAFDYNTVIKNAITEMSNSGLRVVDDSRWSYSSGRTNRIPVAVRRAILTGANQIAQKMSDKGAEILGTDTFEVDAHANPRPTHAEWQGHVYTKDQLVSICGLGTVGGLMGANCGHNYWPFVRGISKPAYTDQELEDLKSTNPVEWNGKELTGYEATQKMRSMETKMRAQRLKVHLMKEAGVDSGTIAAERIKYRLQSREYKEFAKKADFPEQRERIYMDGLGRV